MTNITLMGGLVLVLAGLLTYAYLHNWKSEITTCQSMSASDIAANEVTDKCNLLESQGVGISLGIGLGIGIAILGSVISGTGAVMWYRENSNV